ncbi:MAG TPA: ribbon-helix-helix protein, CopG family [Terriglobales bacterium]|nr:ribbon-helix-helix protein, CopG family [Terriglobales bacterium]
MRRTQLYLEDELWQALRLQARQQGVTVSELARRALREKYLPAAARRQALLAWAGAWKDRSDLPDTEAYIRDLRGGKRLDRLSR